jgi:CBS domain-containing protein
MRVSDFFTPRVVTIEPDATIADAAVLMRGEHVGDVVILHRNTRRPLGILTDRDIVVSIIATGLDPKIIAVNDAMTYELITVRAEDDLADAVAKMHQASVRRLPVVDAEGDLVGMLSLDDVLQVIGRYMDKIASVSDVQRFNERTRKQ